MHADKVADRDVAPLLAAIFELGDELDVESDTAGAFNIGDNRLRIHWLLRRLTLDRFDLATRSKLLVSASEKAALGWLIDFAQSAYRNCHPQESKPPEPEQKWLTTKEDADVLRQRALARIRHASQSGELAGSKNLAYHLFMWREIAHDDGAEVKAWTGKGMDDDAMVATFARAFTSYSWSQGLGMAGLGDSIAKRNTRASVDRLDELLDKSTLRARVEQLATNNADDGSGIAISEFLSAWKRHDTNPRD